MNIEDLLAPGDFSAPAPKNSIKYPDDIVNKLLLGNSLEVMREIPDNSIDLIPTDPPYGISFMSKGWDHVVPSVAIWQECLRILKPGAFAFIMSSPRQDVLSQMIVRLTQAGFDTGFSSIYWTYDSGFPKSLNISKAVDEKLGYDREFLREGIFKDKQPTGLRGASVTNFKDSIGKLYGENGIITAPASPEAKALDGSYGGLQLKPACEIIIVAMKPLNKPTFVEQALYNKHGITWLDDCRIPIANGENIKAGIANSIRNGTLEEHEGYQRPWKEDKELYAQRCEDALERANKLGRFPANILVSDNVLDNGETTKSDFVDGSILPPTGKNDIYNKYKVLDTIRGFNDYGSFSRYFSLDAWWDKKVKELPENIQKTFPFLIVSKPSKGEKNEGLEDIEARQVDITRNDPNAIGCNNPRNRGGAKRVNFHPTVKSIKLFSYLITLGSREGDIILDPFAGSGTTAISSIILNRKFIAIEISPEYYEIADARIALVLKNNNPNNKINLDDLI